jgi:uncharacterized RDD family membrane protein YckC
MQYASRTSRLFGQCVDGFVAVAPLGLFFLLPTESSTVLSAFSLAWAGWACFHVLLADGMEGGQNWGKRAAGTRVVVEATGAPCTFWQSFVRNLLLSVLGPIDWIFIFGERHPRLGDKAAGTIVIPAEY